MSWRKIAMLTSSLAIMGAATTIPTTNAFADEGQVKVTLVVKNDGTYLADICAKAVEPNGDDKCKFNILAGMTAKMEFSVPDNHTIQIHGEAVLGRSKTRGMKVGSASGETHCFLFSGSSLIGFKFREIWGCEGFNEDV